MEQQQLTNFKQELKTKNYSEQSIKTYLYWIEIFLKFTNKPIKDIVKEDITLFFNEKRKHNLNANSLPVIKSAFKLFFEKYLKIENLFDNDIKIRTTRKKEIIIVLNEEEINQLINSVTGEYKLRNQLAMQLGFDGALRVSDARKLEYKNIKKNGNILIRGGKGKKDRITKWEQSKTWTLLQNYLSLYSPKKYLFEKKNGGLYHPDTFQRMIRTAGANSKIDRPSWGWHLLRHSGAVRWYKSKVPLEIIAERMGHASLNTTELYLSNILKGI